MLRNGRDLIPKTAPCSPVGAQPCPPPHDVSWLPTAQTRPGEISAVCTALSQEFGASAGRGRCPAGKLGQVPSPCPSVLWDRHRRDAQGCEGHHRHELLCLAVRGMPDIGHVASQKAEESVSVCPCCIWVLAGMPEGRVSHGGSARLGRHGALLARRGRNASSPSRRPRRGLVIIKAGFEINIVIRRRLIFLISRQQQD